ncbi:unnamed protein product [Aureobasidium mustum]|uniref:Uncharacterized protein n=1 Tax=Aureobasidium mustum TaxID=2773714 RepID=A0A9N8PLU3_9PEZI|nr:unnamed protein product [Aureobasidium mustum]
MSFNHPSLDDHQGHIQEHDHVNNNHTALSYPQQDDRLLTSYTFRDFVTPNEHATIPVVGTSKALESLDHTLSSPGVFARCAPRPHAFSAYTPLAIALSAICVKVGLAPVTERNLAQLHRTPWFIDFAKAAVKRHNAEHMINLNLSNLSSDSILSEDHMVILAEAFAASSNLSNIELGIVAITKKGVKAFHYPWSATCTALTAWIVADLRTNVPAYFGIGHDVAEQQESSNNEHVAEEEEEEDAADDDEDQQAPTTTPRKTAARVLLQQVPLPAGLTAKNILEQHTQNLQYNNILKVGLQYSNQEIAKKVADDAVANNKKSSASSSGIVKRINTAIDFLEKEFEIDIGAFRTAYDTARKDNGIPIRGKDGVDDQTLTANGSKIRDAMAWIKAGGPRPAVAIAPAPAPIPSGYAPASSTPSATQGSVRGYNNNNSIPQLDGTMDEAEDTHIYDPFQPQANGFKPQHDNDQPDWDWVNFNAALSTSMITPPEPNPHPSPDIPQTSLS